MLRVNMGQDETGKSWINRLDLGCTELQIHKDITESEIRAKIATLEASLKSFPDDIRLDPEDCPLVHYFPPGVYCREIHIAAGSVITGKIHRFAHFNFISKGRVTVLTKDGLETLEAPHSMVSSAGTKRALYAHTDVIWTTIHPNPDDIRDVDELEKIIIAPDYAEFPLAEGHIVKIGGI